MKKLFLSVLLALVFGPLYAQSLNVIQNPGFEDWTNMGSYDEPVGWDTMNSMFDPNSTVPVRKTADSHSGNYAISINTIQAGSFIVGGNVLAYAPVDTKPYALSGFFKYLPAGTDTCMIAIIMTRYNPGTGEQLIAGAGTFSSIGAAAYTPFSTVINYDPAFFANVFPDSMRIYLVAGGNGSQVAGSELLVDDLVLQLTPTAAPEQVKQHGLNLFPNPATSRVFVEVPARLQNSPFQLTVTNVLGRVVQSLTLTTQEARLPLDLAMLQPGMYEVRLQQDSAVYSGKLVVSH